MKRATLILALILLPLLASCIEPEQVAEDSLAPHKQSLLPAFQGDIATLGEIPRYRIAVSLDADTLTLTGRQQVLYTNNEDSKSAGLNPRAERAKPLWGCGSPARRALPF